MNPKKLTQHSRFLSLVLRHQPEIIGLQLDAQGWVDVAILLKALNAHGRPINFTALSTIVTENNKQRFAFNEDKSKIRANQGHSIKIDHGYDPVRPPKQLYHGTATRFLDSILATGLQKQKRHHVHLSEKLETAAQVGRRHGKLAILIVDSAAMAAAGHLFYCSENGVWLTDTVPPEYLRQQA